MLFKSALEGSFVFDEVSGHKNGGFTVSDMDAAGVNGRIENNLRFRLRFPLHVAVFWCPELGAGCKQDQELCLEGSMADVRRRTQAATLTILITRHRKAIT